MADSIDLARVMSSVEPEPIREHWVEIDGVRYPPKQAYAILTGQPRSEFTSHAALRELRKRGLATSEVRRASHALPQVASVEPELAESFGTLVRFMSTPLTAHLARAEVALLDARSTDCERVLETFGFSEDLLDAALAVRAGVGRLNDVIHATVIARGLPLILEAGEAVAVRPSLGACNDATRPYDLETDRRIAEFKVAQWRGGNSGRQRGLVADLVHLTLDDSNRRSQLFVVGSQPGKYLATTRTKVSRAIGKSSPRLRQRYDETFGAISDFSVAEFVSGPAAHVEIIDLVGLVPSLCPAADG